MTMISAFFGADRRPIPKITSKKEASTLFWHEANIMEKLDEREGKMYRGMIRTSTPICPPNRDIH